MNVTAKLKPQMVSVMESTKLNWINDFIVFPV